MAAVAHRARAVPASIHWMAAVATVALISCDAPATPSRLPDPPGPQRPPRDFGEQVSTAFGVVYEHTSTDVRPAPGIALRVQGLRPGTSLVTLDLVTDENGSYTVPNLRREYLQVSVVPQDAYASPCSTRTWLWTDQSWNMHVVSRATLMAHGVPASMRSFDRLYPNTAVMVMSGRVTEATRTGPRPVAEAVVEHLYIDAVDPTGYVLTTADGRYTLCGYWDDYGQSLRVRKPGYRTGITTIGASQTIDFELVRE